MYKKARVVGSVKDEQNSRKQERRVEFADRIDGLSPF